MKWSRVAGLFGTYPFLTAGTFICAFAGILIVGPVEALFAAGVVGLLLLAWVLAVQGREMGRELARSEEAAERWRLRSERLAKVATEDETTGVGNSRQFESEWWRFLARYERRGETFSVALLELGDAFRISEPLSPELISRAGQLVAKAARTEDSVCRLGRQRFGVLLSGTPRPGADRFVDRVRIELSSHAFRHAGHTVYVTAYGGVAEWAPEMVSVDRMLAEAEADLERFGTECRTQGAFFAPDGGPTVSAPPLSSEARDDAQPSPHRAA